jgi:hypothetical protein
VLASAGVAHIGHDDADPVGAAADAAADDWTTGLRLAGIPRTNDPASADVVVVAGLPVTRRSSGRPRWLPCR